MSSALLDDLKSGGRVADPLRMASLLWPHVTFYKQQRQIIYSVVNDDETYVPAGNKLGKDFVAGFICTWFFLTRHPCRVITTSAKDDHLRVLWGEIGRFVQSAKYSLDAKKGGPFLVNHQDIHKIVNGEKCPISYMTGLVASQDSIAAMQGHHVANVGDGIPRTLFVSDESSSVPDEYYKKALTWFNRALIFGNTWECDNFFKRGVQGGDLYSDDGGRCYRRVIRIRAEDSPNVRFAQAEIDAGGKPSGKIIVPGVKDYAEYVKNRKLLDRIEQTVILDAQFYEGSELRLFPQDWLRRSVRLHRFLQGRPLRRTAKAIGIDPGEGSASSSISIVDEFGLMKLISPKTPDTQDIIQLVIQSMKTYRVPDEMVAFDRGGGGKQLADQMRSMGYNVRTVGFGEGVSTDAAGGEIDSAKVKEDRYTYRNRRAQMYGELSLLMDPSGYGRGMGDSESDDISDTAHDSVGLNAFRSLADESGKNVDDIVGFAIPPDDGSGRYDELVRQLSKMPKKYDKESQLYLPPKNKKPGSKEVCLSDLIGHSPDEADSLVLAVHAMLHFPRKYEAGVVSFG